jgi:hypothetical protein
VPLNDMSKRSISHAYPAAAEFRSSQCNRTETLARAQLLAVAPNPGKPLRHAAGPWQQLVNSARDGV